MRQRTSTGIILFLLICLLGVASSASAQLRAQLLVSGLDHPVALVPDPTQTNVFFIVQQGGRIRTLVNGALGADFLDLSGDVLFDGEQGLLGMALAPDYASSRRFFVYFTNSSGDNVVARFQRDQTDPLVADAGTRFDLLWPDGGGGLQAFIAHPGEDNHNGGHLAFGPDGMLYIGLGDGGGSDDPDHSAQDPATLHGKMLRIDVSVGDGDAEGYDVPGDNPFLANVDVLPEIWAFGLRNPWRYSFDNLALGGTGGMLIGDVGQGLREEVSFEPMGVGGRNYGWRNWEGAVERIHDPDLPPYFTPLVNPIHDYDRSVGRTITGGYVYRGTALGPNYYGRYFFADYLGPGSSSILGLVWSFRLNIDGGGEAFATDQLEHSAELGAGATRPVSFAEDSDGELYIVSRPFAAGSGAVYKIVADFVTNGDFSAGMNRWFAFAQPAQSDITASVSAGVLQFRRADVPDAPTNQAVIIHPTEQPLDDDTAFVLQFDLGNSSPSRKRIAILVHDEDFSDLSVCTFWIAPNTGLQTYRMRGHTTQSWSGATLSFYAASESPAGESGFYLLDNVSFEIDDEGSIARTDCESPGPPFPPGGAAGPNLIDNGTFSAPINPATDWFTFGEITHRISSGVFEFHWTGSSSAAVIVQNTGSTAIGNREIVTAAFSLGNSSALRQRVTVILHANDFSDLAACTFWLDPGAALSGYEIRAFSTKAWTTSATAATLSVYSATPNGGAWLRLDNVSLRETPGVGSVGTECIEPAAFGIVGQGMTEALGSPFRAIARTDAAPGATRPHSRPTPRTQPAFEVRR